MADNLREKIEGCGTKLYHWASNQFGSIRKRKKELTAKLAESQQYTPDDFTEAQMRKVENELDAVLKQEETMWYQRS